LLMNQLTNTYIPLSNPTILGLNAAATIMVDTEKIRVV
jgi:hypothetical protein